jgi:choline/glycine/proline betaine transport protein
MDQSKSKLSINPPVFFTSALLLVSFLVFGVVATDEATVVFQTLRSEASKYFGWLYVSSVSFFIGFSLWLMMGRYGGIRLGGDQQRPEFSRLTWFSMLFSAGMGIGLVFYGVGEPMMHFSSPPGLEGGTAQAARLALPLTFFHWGIHAWAIYAVMGLAIAYFSYRKGLPLAIRSCFYPLLGERIYGPIGHIIDIIAVFGTLFGLATSLGLGSMQVSAGFNFLFDTPHTITTQLTLIALITLAATISLITGVDKGIRRLSELNMITAGLLMLFVLFVGPTLFVINNFIQNIGSYFSVIVDRSFYVGATNSEGAGWTQGWTIFYWGWWIAWAPFVGMFVARISKGRTIREFISCVLLVPTVVTFLWFSVFGGTALNLEMSGGAAIVDAVSSDISTAIYVMLDNLPLANITSFLAALVVTVFFVTSSDSASFVVDMITSGGHPNPPRWQRVFWAIAEGACAAILLYLGGKEAIDALQAAVISIGLPFCILLVLMTRSLYLALKEENIELKVSQTQESGSSSAVPAYKKEELNP